MECLKVAEKRSEGLFSSFGFGGGIGGLSLRIRGGGGSVLEKRTIVLGASISNPRAIRLRTFGV